MTHHDEAFATKKDLVQIENKVDHLEDNVSQLVQTTNEIKGTIQDLIETIHVFATHTDEQFGTMNKRLTRVEANMVTKEYLDDKLADHASNLYARIDREFVRKPGTATT